MADLSKQGKLKAVIIALTTFVVAAAGYFFAEMKSEPYYASKIDKIMFDTKNRSPKYIITLPDKTPQNKNAKQNVAAQVAEEKITEENLAKVIPLVSRLQAIKNPKECKVLDVEERLQLEENGLIHPKISDNGDKPWIVYGNMVDVLPNYYKVSIVIKNLGMDKILTDAAIQALPSDISLSFSPYTVDADETIRKARQAGHETYVDLLLPSKDYLKSDTGPKSFDLTSPLETNNRRFWEILNHKAAFGGAIINDGVADESNHELLHLITEELKNCGLLMVDATSEQEIEQITMPGLARKKADIVLDHDFTKEKIRTAFLMAENIAKEKGNVLIVASPKPVVLTELSAWIKTFSPQLSYEESKGKTIDKPFVLVPLSNIVVE